jgi:hypothetical protein
VSNSSVSVTNELVSYSAHHTESPSTEQDEEVICRTSHRGIAADVQPEPHGRVRFKMSFTRPAQVVVHAPSRLRAWRRTRRI